jgi:hypothetical protein
MHTLSLPKMQSKAGLEHASWAFGKQIAASRQVSSVKQSIAALPHLAATQNGSILPSLKHSAMHMIFSRSAGFVNMSHMSALHVSKTFGAQDTTARHELSPKHSHALPAHGPKFVVVQFATPRE